MANILFLSNNHSVKEKNFMLLVQNGFTVMGVSGCAESLVALDKEHFDIVVIDEALTDVEGFETCRKLRELPGLLIVLLGSISESDAAAKVHGPKFDAYLRKPVDPRDLLAKIRVLLGQTSLDTDKPLTNNDAMLKQLTGIRSLLNGVKGLIGQPAGGTGKPEAPASAKQGQSVDTGTGPGKASPERDRQDSDSERASGLQSNAEPAKPMAKMDPGPRLAVAPVGKEEWRNPAPIPPQALQQDRVEPTPLFAKPAQHPEVDNAAILNDQRVVMLVEALVSGKLPDITPVVDFSYRAGFAYPSVSNIIDTSESDTASILEMLADNGILVRELYEKFSVDPDGLFQLVPSERCPRCDSSNIIKGQLVEHFSCGYVGLDRDFKQDSRYVCPKCRKDMRLIGTDYRNVGVHYRCQDCSEVFTNPVIKWRNLKTRKIWNSEELREVATYSYQFNHDKKGWLEFQMRPKIQLIGFLKDRGYQVLELAQLTGKSGATHTMDILATRDDIITKINLGIGILVAATGEPEVGLEALFRFDTRAYDIGINYKVVIAIPKLGPEAMNFAVRQNIRAYEAKNLAAVVDEVTRTRSPQGAGIKSVGPGDAGDTSPLADARSKLGGFLRGRGYEVHERALVTGKSGVEHIFDIYALRDDGVIVPVIAMGIVSGVNGQPAGTDEISRFDADAFDTGIKNKVFFGIPAVSEQARQFGKQQRIDVLEQKDLARLI